MAEDVDEAASLYARVPGGAELVAWFGYAPNFHDAEIVELSLRRRSASLLRVQAWRTRPDEAGFFIQDKLVVVTFAMEGLMDLQLNGFSHQNVIDELALRPAPDRPERRPYYWLDPAPDDLEIELEPCFGLSGRIRCKTMRISLVAGEDAG